MVRKYREQEVAAVFLVPRPMRYPRPVTSACLFIKAADIHCPGDKIPGARTCFVRSAAFRPAS